MRRPSEPASISASTRSSTRVPSAVPASIPLGYSTHRAPLPAKIAARYVLGISLRPELLEQSARRPTDPLGDLGSDRGGVFRRHPQNLAVLQVIDDLPEPSHLADDIDVLEEVVAIYRSKRRYLASADKRIELP